MRPAILKQLARVDPVMRRLIRRHGPCRLDFQKRRPPFHSLVLAIAHQQLHAAAAEKILGRFRGLFPKRKFPKPEDLAAVTDSQLRACGFSMAKIRAIRDLTAKTLSGEVPGSRAIGKMDDEEIIQRLTSVRGVGRWTAEMLLIFQLGREDVLPVDDFGVRNGFGQAYRRGQMPSPSVLRRFGEIWRPYRTTAAWYLWRAADQARQEKAQIKKAVKKK